MQNKGAIRFFAIALALVCIFQLSFTFFTKKIESQAEDYANREQVYQKAKELADGNKELKKYYVDSLTRVNENYYLDSMKNEVVYNFLWLRKYTFQECKEREINLGLDLKGGMNVTLEVSVVDIIQSMARNPDDKLLKKAITRANELQKESQEDYITLFAQAFEEVAPNAKLAGIFNTIELKEQINYNSTNEEVISVIRKEADAAIDRTFNILRTRIDRFGVAQPNIQRIPTTGRIVVELPGVKDHSRVRKLLQSTAQLEFWETYNLSEIYNYIEEANAKLRQLNKRTKLDTTRQEKDTTKTQETGKEDEISKLLSTGEETDTTKPAEQDTSEDLSIVEQLAAEEDTAGIDELATQEQSLEQFREENPLLGYLRPALVQDESGNYYPSRGPVVGYAKAMDTARVNKMLKDVSSIFPRTLKFRWSVNPVDEEGTTFPLIALKVTTRDGSAPLDGEAIVDARQDYDRNGQVQITMSMNNEGAKTWKRLTAENVGRAIAVVLDNLVYTHPNVNEEIPTGRSVISGGFTIEEAQDIANILKAGKLPAPARIVEEAIVGPSLGKESINDGFLSFAFAFLIVLIYMALFYNRGGLVANFALLANVFFIFGVLASLGAVLTLPGIAGIVLTLGMAVDANVIIYERIREEVRAGKGIRLAITDGYKNAYSAIIDGNVTTLLTGIVLFTFGSGPVQGFATTLIIGICTSLFSAIFLSRLIFSRLIDKNKKVTFDNKVTRNFLREPKFDFIKARKIGYTISVIVMAIGLASLVFKGLNLGVDFAGGRTYVVRFDNEVKTNEVRNSLSDEFGQGVVVKTFGPSTQVKITTKYMIEEKSPKVDSLVEAKLFEGVKGFFYDPIDYEYFTSDKEDKLTGVLSSQKVDPTISDDLYRAAIWALILSLLVIFAYIALRFKKWQYGFGGLLALVHDSFIVVSLYSIFSGVLPFTLEVDQAFIAAILTIIGYSINDSVVIFDRVREFTNLHPKRDFKENVNNALNTTLSRTFNTSGTTFIVLLMIFIFGGEVIRGFAFALMIGVLIGTYSSLFNATPIAYDFIKMRERKNELKGKNKKQPQKKKRK